MDNGFNVRLKSLRKARKKTQTDISELLNITRSTYGEYERGKIKPPMDKLKFLANYFDVTTDYLIGTSEESINTKDEPVKLEDKLDELLNLLKSNTKLTYNDVELTASQKDLTKLNLQNVLLYLNIFVQDKTTS